MRTGRNVDKIAHLIRVLVNLKHHYTSAKNIADEAGMSNEAVLAWMYALHEEGLVECLNENPRLWRWKE